MNKNLRIYNKVRNLLIYLSNNLIFSIGYVILIGIILLLIIASNKFNIVFYCLFFCMMEGSFIMTSLRITDKKIVKMNKLRYVIFSNFAPILYPLLLFSNFVYKIIARLFNLENNIINIIIYLLLIALSIFLALFIVKKYEKKIKNGNDLKVICK